jgi:GAF domain-containing protein
MDGGSAPSDSPETRPRKWSLIGALQVLGPKKHSRVHVPPEFEDSAVVESALNEDSLSLLGVVTDAAIKSPVLMLKRLISLQFATAQFFSDTSVGENRVNDEARRAFIDLPVSGSEVCVIENCREDERLRNNIFVMGLPHVRFYAGVAIMVDGKKIGALYVADREARESFSPANRTMLIEFGVLISATMQDRADVRAAANEESTKMMASLSFGV